VKNLKENCYILGAGAIGCLWAKWLYPNAVLLLNPKSQLAQGIATSESKTIEFSFEFKNEKTLLAIPCALASKDIEISQIIICTKANQTEEALKNIDLAEGAEVLLFQNGMGNAEMLEKQFPQATIFCGTTTHGAFRKSNQSIVHAGLGENFIGQLTPNPDLKKLKALRERLNKEEVQVEIDSNMEKRLWLKLAINCAINPLTVIYQCKNGELLQKEEAKARLTKICKEIDPILHKKELLNTQESCLDTVIKVAQDTAENYSSMYQDFKNKTPSEIDFIQGFVCQEAEKLQLPCPENRSILDTIKKIEANY
jgi:2-dehydropantoate 2-reductase